MKLEGLLIAETIPSNSFKRGLNVDLATISTLVATLATIMFTLYAISQMRSLKKKAAKYEPLIESIGDLLRYEESEDGTPMIDARLTKMVDAFSSGIAKSLKMSLLGSLSGPARLEKGLKGAIAKDVLEKKAPVINLVGDLLGFNTQKYVSKHPDAMLQLVQKFAPQLQGFMGNSNPQNQGSRMKNSFGNG